MSDLTSSDDIVPHKHDSPHGQAFRTIMQLQSVHLEQGDVIFDMVFIVKDSFSKKKGQASG